MVERALSSRGALGRHQAVEPLLTGHLAVAVSSGGMEEAAVVLPVAEQVLQQGMAVFDKSGIIQINAQGAQAHDDLYHAFGAAGIVAGIATVALLGCAQIIQCPVNGRLDLGLGLVTGQSLEGHAGDIRVALTGHRLCRSDSSRRHPAAGQGSRPHTSAGWPGFWRSDSGAYHNFLNPARSAPRWVR